MRSNKHNVRWNRADPRHYHLLNERIREGSDRNEGDDVLYSVARSQQESEDDDVDARVKRRTQDVPCLPKVRAWFFVYALEAERFQTKERRDQTDLMYKRRGGLLPDCLSPLRAARSAACSDVSRGVSAPVGTVVATTARLGSAGLVSVTAPSSTDGDL